MQVRINGKPRDVEGGATIMQFLQAHEINPALVAVEHNGEIIRRERLGDVRLEEGDTLEVVHMVGGG